LKRNGRYGLEIVLKDARDPVQIFARSNEVRNEWHDLILDHKVKSYGRLCGIGKSNSFSNLVIPSVSRTSFRMNSSNDMLFNSQALANQKDLPLVS